MGSILDRLLEPTDPEERRTAIKICRLNFFLDPETGKPEPDREKTHRLFGDLEPSFPYEKWLWIPDRKWESRFDAWESARAALKAVSA